MGEHLEDPGTVGQVAGQLVLTKKTHILVNLKLNHYLVFLVIMNVDGRVRILRLNKTITITNKSSYILASSNLVCLRSTLAITYNSLVVFLHLQIYFVTLELDSNG